MKLQGITKQGFERLAHKVGQVQSDPAQLEQDAGELEKIHEVLQGMLDRYRDASKSSRSRWENLVAYLEETSRGAYFAREVMLSELGPED